MRITLEKPSSIVAKKSQGDAVKTFFRLPDGMRKTYLERVVADGYGQRGKSRWTREAIDEFLAQPNWVELFSSCRDIPVPGDEREHVYLLPSMVESLHNAGREIRTSSPQLEGTGLNSAIIRAAITIRIVGVLERKL